MKRLLAVFIVFVALGISSYVIHVEECYRPPQELQNSSVMVFSAGGNGSATIFNRRILVNELTHEYVTITFGITAYHIAEEYPLFLTTHPHQAIPCKTLYNLKDEDITVFMLPITEPFLTRTRFETSYEFPELGSDIQSISCPNAGAGFNTYMKGHLTYINKELQSNTYDQTDLHVYGGSSGGGVYTINGTYIGMITCGSTIMPAVSYITPIRKIHFALDLKKAGWILDERVTPPTLSQLLAL